MEAATAGEGLADAMKNMQNDPELMAAFVEAQAELEGKKSKKKKKKKKKQVGDQLAELEQMMAQLEQGEGEMDLETATATLAMLEEESGTKKKKKKIKKEKLPAPFKPMPAEPEEATLTTLDFQPTEAEIEEQFQILKAEQEAKKKKKEKEKRRQERNLLRDENGEIVKDENGVPITLDSLADMLGDEDLEDEEMRLYLEKKKKQAAKKKKKKVKKEKVDRAYQEDFDPAQFVDGGEGDFGWAKKDAEKKQFKPKRLNAMKVDGEEQATIAETEEEEKRRKLREEGVEMEPADAPVTDDFGPSLPATGIPQRAETGAIPGGSKLKPIEDDEVIEERLRQKQLQKAIQERLDRRLQRQKRIEVRLSTWINKQQSLKNEAKQIAEERIQRAQEITEAMAPGIHAENEAFLKKRTDIVAQVRNQLREEVSAEVRREIEEEENRKIRKTEKAPEAPKVPAAVMDAIQMSDAWEQFWRRYKSQLQNWSHWDEEQEEYHKQAAGWYFTQGFIQSQVQNNVPAAPDEDPTKVVEDPDAHASENLAQKETEIDAKMVSSATTSSAPVPANQQQADDESVPPTPGLNIPAPPTHTLEEEERIEKLEKKKKNKLDRYDELLKDPIFNPDQAPVYQPWGAKDGELRVQPGLVAPGIATAPQGASFAPKVSAMPQEEKAKLARMQRMLATVRGPQAMKQQTVGTTFLPTQTDALQFIQLERFRRDRHRFKSSDQDTESESEDEAPRERGARRLPYMPQMEFGGTEQLTQTSTQETTMPSTDVNQPGEMVNPAGEEIEASSSDSSDSETEEERERRLKMAAKFNPANIYGDSATTTQETKKPEKVQIRRFDGRTDTSKVTEVAEDGFGFDFLGGADKGPDVTIKAKAGAPSGASKEVTKKAKLYDRSKYVPSSLPQEPEGPGIHKEGPLKGISKMWKQEQGLRQRPRESAKQQFVEVSEEHLPPKQLGLPEYVQDIPDTPQTSEDVKNMATMAVRDYQQEHLLMKRKKTRMEEYMERRNADKRFAAEPIAEKESTPTGANIDLAEESLDFDPASFFGSQTGGMFTSSKKTAEPDAAKKKKATPKPAEPSAAAKKAFDLPKEGDKPKKRFAGFGASWKKKTIEPTKIAIKTTIEKEPEKEAEKEQEEELPDFLKEQEKLMEEGEEKKEEEKKDDGFWVTKEEKPKKRKGTKEKKRKEGAEDVLGEEKKSKRKKFNAGWMDRMGEDPDKPLKESSAGMEIDESELRTYNDGNPKNGDGDNEEASTAVERTAGDRDDRDWGAWKPRSRQVAVKDDENKVVVKRKEGELSELHKKLLDPARFDYDPDFARAGSLQFMHPLQCSKVLGRPYPEDLAHKGQKALDDDITAYREPAPIQDPAELGPEPPPDGAIFWGVPEEVLTDPRLVVLKVGVPENCPGPEPRGWLDGLKRRKWYDKAQAPEIRPVHPASYFKRGDQLHQDKTFGVFYHPKYYGITKEQKAQAIQQGQDQMLADSRASLKASFQKGGEL